ncbi:hypothetical protein [Hyphomonas sp.]|uniref:hypothetical protein n=1 Tax=Hyphomonas sp. TaxID=87 RepID=UPI0025C654F8|nr:hypothetical protein [Hyphomonas sp.]
MRQAVLSFIVWMCCGFVAHADIREELGAIELFERVCLQGDLQTDKMKREVQAMGLPEIGSRTLDGLMRGVLPAERIGFQCAPDDGSQCYIVLAASGEISALDRRFTSLGLFAESERIDPAVELVHPLTREGTGRIGGKSCVVYGQESARLVLDLVSSIDVNGSVLRSPKRVTHFNDDKKAETGNAGKNARWTNYFWSIPDGNQLNLSVFLDRTDAEVNFALSYSGPVRLGEKRESYSVQD